ncbi:hypothetical protein [Nodosilinea sp. E11]|uniref:hypothetical protein n=1 Tax=Nodosilinea sp. E11 TaxID=3037479 RepID=UPI002934486C|nr:hypothetical protein [Nodosilinea sp. E11]WOD37222.1 hypothetical protein RRF56_01820 [Nodosilinea sp. E11]
MSHIDFSKLKGVKVIHDPSGCAYNRDRSKEMPNAVDFNHVTIFPLGFRTNKANQLEAAEQIALIQNGKLTHIVELLDCEAYEDGGWYHRICRVLWWWPNVDMNTLGVESARLHG